MTTALLPESVLLARAAWDAATPGSRVMLLLRVRYAARRALEKEELAFPFGDWESLPFEVAQELAWDVQFMRRVLGDGRAALKAATASGERLAA